VESYNIAGIVDSIKAVRGREDKVLHLEATIHVKHNFTDRYSDNVTTKWILPIVVSDEVNAGDIVLLTINIDSPIGKRFAPALTASSNDTYDIDDDDDE